MHHVHLKAENSQDYAQKPQRNGAFMNSASGQHHSCYQLFTVLSVQNVLSFCPWQALTLCLLTEESVGFVAKQFRHYKKHSEV
jgi:hypothetical protein